MAAVAGSLAHFGSERDLRHGQCPASEVGCKIAAWRMSPKVRPAGACDGPDSCKDLLKRDSCGGSNKLPARMGKKRTQVRQVKKTMKQVRPKPSAGAAGGSQQRRQRERYVEAGGFLQGYSPESIIRLGYYSAAVVVVCVLIMVYLLLGGPGAPHSRPARVPRIAMPS